jgi:hypothetical protein
MRLTAELIGRFEQHIGEGVESLLTRSLAVPGNLEGYALYRDGPIRASLSTNPHARWATQTYGLTGCSADAVTRLVDFFEAHRVPACARIVPPGFTAEQADALSARGLRQTAFHATAWAPLPLPAVPAPDVDIREVATEAEMDTHIDFQLAAWDAPPPVIDYLRPLRRTWLGLEGRRFYLAYVDGTPAAQAILSWRDDIGYLEHAGTLPQFRRRGLQLALVRRRIADATALGCRVIFGGADFGSQSLANQIACGLSVAYLAARWTQRR